MSSRIRTKVNLHTYEVRCPECDYNFKVKDEKLGKKLISLHMLKKHKTKLEIKQLETRYDLTNVKFKYRGKKNIFNKK